MTNAEKFKTPQDRAEAFERFCNSNDDECRGCPLFDNSSEPRTCAIFWLDLDAEDEKPLPCPFCGHEVTTYKWTNGEGFSAECRRCGYFGSKSEHKDIAIAAHNRVAKAVMDAKEGGAK